MSEELKPCPFCGETKLKLEKKATRYRGHKAYVASIRCNSCHARGGTVTNLTIPYAVKEDVENEACMRWNRIKPILFNKQVSTEMVRAILDGRKNCTRRLVKTRRKDICGFYVTRTDGLFTGIYEYDENESIFDNPLQPPYQIGDILYVRETWCDDRQFTREDTPGRYFYKASEQDGFTARWRPSIHMPKEAARIWLKVTDVRVERLQNMDWRDALDEGINTQFPRDKETGEFIFDENPIDDFIDLWNSTIKKSDLDRYGWDTNPWVWVIEFEQCEKPEGEN